MKKTIGWIFTGVGAVGLLPALYGMAMLGGGALDAFSRNTLVSLKDAALCSYLFLMLVAGLLLWVGNIRYSLGKRVWGGTACFWFASGFYNIVFVLSVAGLALGMRFPPLLGGLLYPALASVLSFKMARNERDGGRL